MPMKPPGTTRIAATPMDRLVLSLDQAARHSAGETEKPAAILWTDEDEQWLPLVEPLQARLPHLLVHGPYDPAKRTGPAIWLRCVIARTLAALPEEAVPVIYLPGVSRQQLRAGEECPRELQPLVELQYRGAVWTQRNGKDWTVEGFFGSEDGLGLDVARDAATRSALRRALRMAVGMPLTRLSGKRLEAADFDQMLVGDTARELLEWMSDPRRERDRTQWEAFRDRCVETYGFDPAKDGETVAGEKLGLRQEQPWRMLWDRYAEAPDTFSGIPKLLERSKPAARLVFDKSTWPDENETAEAALRDALLKLEGSDPAAARKKIAELENEHGPRRQWVWAKLGRSLLAAALEHLAVVAERTASTLGGETPDDMARLYEDGAYRADDAAWKTLASVKSAADWKAVEIAVRAVHLPWCDDAARRFQEVVARRPLPAKGATPEVPEGECILFVDGLRYDLAQGLADMLEQQGLRVSRSRRWAALPSVTATAKPALAPFADRLSGKEIPPTFNPTASGKELSVDRFRKLLSEAGCPFIPPDETEPGARGWTESGDIDHIGHELQAKLVTRIEDELDALCERVRALFEAGWRSVRVVTDHGWLLMPGKLPKHDLPAFLVTDKWGRCAVIKGDSKVSVPTAPWYWNPGAEFATAPGIACFAAGYEYAHGGLSLQECLVQDLRVQPADAKVAARIADVQWIGMRCRVRIEPVEGRLQIDLRTKVNDPASSLAVSRKPVTGDGSASLVVADEDLAGTAAMVVLLDAAGSVLARESTIVGGVD